MQWPVSLQEGHVRNKGKTMWSWKQRLAWHSHKPGNARNSWAPPEARDTSLELLRKWCTRNPLALEQHPLLPFLSSPGCVRPMPVGSVSIFCEYEAWAQVVVLAVFCYLNFVILKRELDLHLKALDYILLLIHVCIYPSNKYLLRT